MTIVDEQNPPAAYDPAKPCLWDLVVADLEHFFATADVRRLALTDMRERDAGGLAKYGTRLQPNNGRDALVDAYQEHLDGAVYLKQAFEETKPGRERTRIAGFYRSALRNALDIREAIWERDGR